MQRVAEKEAVEPEELPPIYDVLDTDHLARLMETAHGSLTVEFTYCGYTIVIDGDGRVHVTETASNRS